MFRSSIRLALLVVPMFAAFAPETARADALDVELMKRAAEVRDYLVGHRYESVGILAFRLKRGEEAPTFRGGLIVNSLPERLEAALIMSLVEGKHSLKVAHAASATAAKALGEANYRTAAERAKLFDVKYSQAWGSPRPQIKVDAFLAGKIVVDADLGKIAVEIELFDRRDPNVIADVVRFETKVDRHILADIGQGFTMSTGPQGRFLRALDETDIISGVQQSMSEKTPPTTANSTSTNQPTADKTPAADKPAPESKPVPADKPKPIDKSIFDGKSASTTGGLTAPTTAPGRAFPVTVTLLYDGVEQPLQDDPSVSGNSNFMVRTPRAGEKLEIGVKNLSNEKLALVVTVNGLNTLYEQKGQSTGLKKWVLDPGGDYVIKGYYQEGGTTYKTIRALSERDSQNRFADLGGDEAAGLVQVYVFRPLANDVVIGSINVPPSIRRMSENELALNRADTLSELQSLIVPGKFNRGLFAWSDTATEALEKGTLGPIQLTDTMIIRYYQKGR